MGLGSREKTMETTIVYWSYMGIREKNVESTIMGYIGFRVQGLHWEFTTQKPARLAPLPT